MTRTDQWLHRTLGEEGGRTAGGFSVFEREGSPELAPVVLLHGAGGNALTWTPIAPAFAQHRVLLVDMPAHGRSASPSRWDLVDTAASIARAVEPWLGQTRLGETQFGETQFGETRFGESQPGESRAIWGGHSWGGKVAGLIAASNPSRCRGLVLIDPSPSAAVPIDVEGFVDDTWGVEMQPYESVESAVEAAKSLRHWQPWDDAAQAAFRHGLTQHADGFWLLRPTREDLLALATATLHFDAGELLAGASAVPTLLLVAEESSAWQGVTNMLAYANATQQVIAGHHWIHQCSREAVTTAISSWIAKLDG